MSSIVNYILFILVLLCTSGFLQEAVAWGHYGYGYRGGYGYPGGYGYGGYGGYRRGYGRHYG